MSEVLMIIKVDDNDYYVDGGSVKRHKYEFFKMIDSIIIPKNEMNDIKYIIKKFPEAEVYFRDFSRHDIECLFEHLKIKFIKDETCVKSFKKIFGKRCNSVPLYEYLTDSIKRCYRSKIEQSECYYNCRPWNDALTIGDLIFIDEEIDINPRAKRRLGHKKRNKSERCREYCEC
jgi:hypothetical protein